MKDNSNLLKRIKSLLLVAVFLITTIGPVVPSFAVDFIDIPQSYDELESSWTIAGGKLTYLTYAKQKESSISFGHVGLTISRCADNTPALRNGAATEWVAFTLNEGGYFYENVRNMRTRDGVPVVSEEISFNLSDIYNEIVRCGYTEWAAEFKRFYIDGLSPEDVVYLRIDFILVSQYNYADGDVLNSGEYLARTKTAGREVYLNTPDVDGLNPDQIRYHAVNPDTGARPIHWGSKTLSDLENYYNIYVPTGGGAPPVIPVGSSQSLYETKNYSSIYNVSKAIPSGEDVINAVSASSFKGDMTTHTFSPAPTTYSATYNYYYRTQHMDLTYVGKTYWYSDYVYTGPGSDYSSRYNYILGRNEYFPTPGTGYFSKVDYYKGNGNYDGDGTPNPNGEYDYRWNGAYDTHSTGSHTFTYTATVSYIGITDVDIQTLNSMSVYNSAFPGGNITYDTAAFSNKNVAVSMLLYSMSAANAGRAVDNVTNGFNLTGYNFTPNSNHYGLAPSYSITGANIDVGKALTAEELNGQIARDGASIRSAIANGCWSRNDGMSVNDNGHTTTFLDNTTCTGAIISDGTNTYTVGEVASQKYPATSVASFVNGLNAERSTASRTVTIPTTTPNADYPTGLTATWTSVFGKGDSTLTAGTSKGFSDSIYKHVMTGGILSDHMGYYGGDEGDGYPIRVHTPVIAPIEIVFNDGTPAIETTQLVSSALNTGANYELLLDKMYYLKFDTTQWYSQIYGVPEGYGTSMDEYVSKKTVRFPFGVVYNGRYYPRTATGYTAWIEVQTPGSIYWDWNSGVDVSKYESANHWQMMPFYIPSFSNEVGYTGSDAYVEVAVYAYNYTGLPFADDDDTPVNIEHANAYTSEYVASTRRQLQTSGWIYDFSVVGTTNQALYTGNGMVDSDIYDKIGALPLADIKNELKMSELNRLGTTNIRYLKDGSITSSLNLLQKLPLRDGQSFAFNAMGNVWRGQEFAFTIKTISNLNGKNDYLRITPKFEYVKSDGTVLDMQNGDFKFYTVSEASGKMKINEFDPTDYSMAGAKSINLADELFKESYYDTNDMFGKQQLGDWLQSSADKENINNSALGYLTTITAREYKNRKTSTYTTNSIYIPSTLRLCSGEYEQLEMNDGISFDRAVGAPTLTTYWNTISNYSDAFEDEFRYSMQQWHSLYSIPENSYIIDTRSLGGAAFDIRNYIDHQSHFSWETAPIIDDGKGTLVISFDIVAYKDGVPYMTYDGGNNVACVAMEKVMSYYFEPAIQNIN